MPASTSMRSPGSSRLDRSLIARFLMRCGGPADRDLVWSLHQALSVPAGGAVSLPVFAGEHQGETPSRAGRPLAGQRPELAACFAGAPACLPRLLEAAEARLAALGALRGRHDVRRDRRQAR